jgi:uncharacterized protein YqfA (UPF0365 family)
MKYAWLLFGAMPDLPDFASWIVIAGALGALVGLALLMIVINYGKIWFQAYMSNARVTVWNLIGMSLRKVDKDMIVKAKVMALQSGIMADPGSEITSRRLEAHYLAGGNVPNVVKAIIAAHRADIDLDFDRAAAIDLAGRDVLDAVQTSVNPKVIDCPDPATSRKTTLSAIAKNGVELKVRARVTVRTNLKQLIGGATEETIIARVGEGIITSIGSAESHLIVMENPDSISKAVLKRGLDAHTAFEIVSIDIADIEVGENIGARLQADQAEADTRVARAKAEERRAIAIAREQEMKALTAENRSRVVLAEAEVPLAMAQAFQQGNFYLHDKPASNGAPSDPPTKK